MTHLYVGFSTYVGFQQRKYVIRSQEACIRTESSNPLGLKVARSKVASVNQERTKRSGSAR